MHDIVTFLRGFPPFDTADMQALDKVARTVTIEFFGQDAAILNGNATEDAYVIRTGQVELLDDNGIVDVLGPGELVGLPSLLTDMPAGLSTRAAEDVLAYRIPADVLVPLLADRSGLRFVAQHVAQRAAETTTRQQAADVTAARVATYARPVVIVPGDEPLKDVIHKMREAGASSALVSGPPEGSWGSSPTATCATGSWLKAWGWTPVWPSQRHSRHALWIRCCRWVRPSSRCSRAGSTIYRYSPPKASHWAWSRTSTC